MRARKVTVYKHPEKTRTKRWTVRYRDAENKRHFRFFDARDEADTYAVQRRIELENSGTRALTAASPLEYPTPAVTENSGAYPRGSSMGSKRDFA